MHCHGDNHALWTDRGPEDNNFAEDDEALPNIPGGRVEDNTLPEEDMIPFWQCYRPWLNALGIYLWDLRRVDYMPLERWICPSPSPSSRLPFATRLGRGSVESNPGRPVQSKFGLGQDALGNDVYIKLTDKGSAEHRVNQYLLSLSNESKSDPCPYALRPVAVLDSPHDFSFIAMPCWGSGFIPENLDRVGQVLVYIKCLLTGLSFLHEHRIAHRDIRECNTLVNGYCPEMDDELTTDILMDHIRSSSNVAFCIFDYDHAIQLSPDTSLKHCFRPSEEAHCRGSPEFHPTDLSSAEPYYNPFAFDVGCLGTMFACFFSEAVRVVPQLAPLFARMTTHVVDQRFTAQEALSFFDRHFTQVSGDALASPISPAFSFDALRQPDVYWSLLSPGDCKLWSDYQVPPRSWYKAMLSKLARTTLGWRVLWFVRQRLRV